MLYSQSRGQGPAVILLHGLFGMGDNLLMLARALSSDFQLHTLDLRNHGRSPWMNSMSFDEMAADVLAFMDQQGIVAADCVGHSLGGKVAMQLALNAPNRVRRLVVADIAPVDYASDHDQVFAALRQIDLSGVTSRGDVNKLLANYLEDEGVKQFLLKSLYRNENGDFAWRMNVDVLYQCYEQLRQGFTTRQQFNGPTLFIKGENSSYIQQQHQAAIERLFPNFQFKVIQGTGHWLHAEKPAVFNRLVQRFLLAH